MTKKNDQLLANRTYATVFIPEWSEWALIGAPRPAERFELAEVDNERMVATFRRVDPSEENPDDIT